MRRAVTQLHGDLSEYITKDKLAGELGVSTTTIDRWRQEGLPCHRWSKRVLRFRVAEVERWLARRSP